MMSDNNFQLWEILVPTTDNNGKPFRTRYHRVWDKKVRDISGGLTILTPAKGQWISPSGKLFIERMIPVRFVVKSSDEAKAIVEYTIKYYKQEAVMAYKLSDEVLLIENKTKEEKKEHET